MKSYLFVHTMVFILLFISACSGIISDDSLINGTTWLLTSLDNQPVLENTNVTIDFVDGKVSGSSGCNSYGGTYSVRKEKITTDSIVMTLMACMDAGVMEQETAFLEILQNAQTYEVTDSQLLIHSSEGKSLTFTQNQ